MLHETKPDLNPSLDLICGWPVGGRVGVIMTQIQELLNAFRKLWIRLKLSTLNHHPQLFKALNCKTFKLLNFVFNSKLINMWWVLYILTSIWVLWAIHILIEIFFSYVHSHEKIYMPEVKYKHLCATINPKSNWRSRRLKTILTFVQSWKKPS